MITSVVTTKGGAGRSTIALNLAVASAASGASTLLIDSDDRATIHQAFERRLLVAKRFNQHRVDVQFSISNLLPQTLPALVANYDAIFVDTPVDFDFRIRELVAASDLVLTPISVGYQDLEHTLEIARLLKIIQTANPKLSICGVLNQWEVSPTPIAGTILRILERLTHQLPLMKSILRHRPEYATAFSYGVGVIEFEPDSEAAAEVASLHYEISRFQSV